MTSSENLMWLFETPAGVPGSPTLRWLRVASAPGYNHPSAPGYFQPRLLEAMNMKRTLVAPRRTFGTSEIDVGEVTLDNVDGIFDEWFDFGYGHPGSRVLLGTPDTPYDQLVVVQNGKVEQPSGSRDKLNFRFRDRSLELDRPVSPTTYLGTNSGITGHEGTPQDIKGQSKIRIFGAPYNVTPDPGNANNRVYLFNHDKDGILAPVSTIVQRLNASPWTLAGNDASMATLEAASISQGNYRTSVQNGAERLGGSLPGTGGNITADVVESAVAADNEIASVVRRILIDAGVAPGDIDVDLGDTGSPSQTAWQVGVVARNDTYRSLINMITGQAAINVFTTSAGGYKVRKFTGPGTPVIGLKKFDYPNIATANDFELRSLERIVTNDDGRGVPARRITVNYLKMWTVQDKDAMASGLSDATKEFYGREYRSVTVENPNPGIVEQFPEAVELVFNTVLNKEGDALQLANLLMGIYGVPRQMYNAVARLTTPLAQAIDLGDTVRVWYNRYGLDNGKDFVITGLRPNPKKVEYELEIYG